MAILARRRSRQRVDLDEVRRVRDHMSARGPDGSGEWCSADRTVALAHRRLSIIDLTERAAQPMASVDGRLVVSFNGEIYNYGALRQALAARGHAFQTQSDTEVLLCLYAEHGVEMFRYLRGMYAFVLWDERRRALLVARDPYGIKPLYLSDDGDFVRIASQVKALLDGTRISRDPDPAGLVGFLSLGHLPEPYTLYRRIRAVPAGSYWWIDEDGPRAPTRFFSLARVFRAAVEAPIRLGGAASQRAVQQALRDSVEQHLVADVPVGAFLSAGVDSGALVGLMRNIGQRDVKTVTVAYREFRGTADDEAPLASQVARRYGAAHSVRTVSRGEFEVDRRRILDAMDQPSIDGVNTWFASKAAAELGLKVAVSGLGGDELFGGYASFSRVPREAILLAPPARIPGLGTTWRRAVELLGRLDGRLSPKLAGLFTLGGSIPGVYLLRRGLFLPWELPALVGTEVADEGLRTLALLEHIAAVMTPDPGSSFARVAVLEAALYMRNQLLRDTDWASMAHSLEVRTPLVDATLLERLAPLLVGTRRVRGKMALARSPAPPLPRAVTARSKTGFGVPMARWLDQPGGELDAWRRVPALRRPGCQWARRLAYALLQIHLPGGFG